MLVTLLLFGLGSTTYHLRLQGCHRTLRDIVDDGWCGEGVEEGDERRRCDRTNDKGLEVSILSRSPGRHQVDTGRLRYNFGLGVTLP